MDRRYKLAYMSHEVATALFDVRLHPEHVLVIPKSNGIPEGCKVVTVNYDYSRQAFAVTLFHPSFDEVPDCCILPEIGPAEWLIEPAYSFLEYGEALRIFKEKLDAEPDPEVAEMRFNQAMRIFFGGS